jgi:hypothetical protein
MEDKYSSSGTQSMSDDIRLLAQAFLLAKQEFIATGKNGKNDHQKWNYAKIEDIYRAVEAGLAQHNIFIWHFARPLDTVKEILYTRLVHAPSGQWIEDARFLESEKPGNQARGSANTYMKKYAVLSLCSIATEDDDGEAEEKHIKTKMAEPTISDAHVRELQMEIKGSANGKDLYGYILTHYKIKDLKELKASMFDSALMYITTNAETK